MVTTHSNSNTAVAIFVVLGGSLLCYSAWDATTMDTTSAFKWVLLFGAIVAVQDVILLFWHHHAFASSELCRNTAHRIAAGMFADMHCDEHEQIAYNWFSLRLCKLFMMLIYDLVVGVDAHQDRACVRSIRDLSVRRGQLQIRGGRGGVWRPVVFLDHQTLHRVLPEHRITHTHPPTPMESKCTFEARPNDHIPTDNPARSNAHCSPSPCATGRCDTFGLLPCTSAAARLETTHWVTHLHLHTRTIFFYYKHAAIPSSV